MQPSTSICDWHMKCFWFSTTLKWQTDSLAPYVGHNGRLFCRFLEKLNSGTSLLTFCEVAHEGELSGISANVVSTTPNQFTVMIFCALCSEEWFFVLLRFLVWKFPSCSNRTRTALHPCCSCSYALFVRETWKSSICLHPLCSCNV